MAEDKLYVLASDVAISEQKSNDIFLLVELRILSTRPNGNSQGVTLAFIDEIVANPEKYACLPLYADVRRLLNGDYMKLGHMYDKAHGEFHTTQVGSITSFRKVEDRFGASLIAEARIPKREADTCRCVTTLYEANMLNFSFEIKYAQEATVEKDGVLYVDADERNALTGVAIVTVPAYKESIALNLVAEQQSAVTSEAEGVETTMTLEEAMAKIAEQEKLIAELTVREEKTEQKTVTVEGDVPPQMMDEAVAAKCDPKSDSACAESMPEDKKEACAESVTDKTGCAECTPDKTGCAECAPKDKACAESAEAEKKTCAECNMTDKTSCAACPAYPEALAAARYETAECKKQIAALAAQCDTLRSQLEAAMKCKAELEQMKQEKAAAELAASQARAKCFAERQGLNVEDEKTSRAIAELDYKAIAEMAMEHDAPKGDNGYAVASSLVTDGFEMKGGKYDDLLAPAN